MRKTAVLIFCALCSPPALAIDQQAAPSTPSPLEACMQHPESDREACLQAHFEPTPEQAARAREGRGAVAAYHARVASLLAASGQPRELAFAATLQRFADWTHDEMQVPAAATATGPRDASQADQWWREAAAIAGDDVIAWTLLLQDDAKTRTQAAARWQTLEPDNLAAWLAGNPSSDALFAAAGLVTYYDQHFYPRVRWMAEALRAHPPTAAEARGLMAGSGPVPEAFDLAEFAAIAAFGIDMAVAMPALAPLMDGCSDAALAATPSRRDDCRHVADLLLDDPGTVLAENIGIGLLQRLARSQAEHAAVAERRRRFDWQMQQYLRLEMEGAASGSDDFLRLFGDPAIGSERELIERLLREADVPLQPPAGWVSSRPH